MRYVIFFVVMLVICVACFINAVRLMKKRKNAIRVWTGPSLEADLSDSDCQISRNKVLAESLGRMKNYWVQITWQTVTPRSPMSWWAMRQLATFMEIAPSNPR